MQIPCAPGCGAVTVSGQNHKTHSDDAARAAEAPLRASAGDEPLGLGVRDGVGPAGSLGFPKGEDSISGRIVLTPPPQIDMSGVLMSSSSEWSSQKSSN